MIELCGLVKTLYFGWISNYKCTLQGYFLTFQFSVPTGELQPPAFTLIATSSSLSINVYQKPILRKLFPYGHTYTIYLEETEQNKVSIRNEFQGTMRQKKTAATLSNNPVTKIQNTLEFSEKQTKYLFFLFITLEIGLMLCFKKS